ncbi:hypothetical protein Pyrfu_0310 [Pyrolobus fumarii 1A]|uniref:Uncharacterized protein n=1 Tax=Pyrolobus fumarii (strain DSM 11204 / 1A) TaxID=694429 RepID=G0EFD9_PYRF1|nr:hypothetical protein Pyrfu_0310 [Pyrolobus fumarii 1A]
MLIEERRDLAAAVAGVVTGAERRGLRRKDVHLLVFLVAYGLGKVGDWGFEASEEGPRSNLVDKVIDELYDVGVLTLRFERSLGGEPLYVLGEVEKLPWLESSSEFQVGFEASRSLVEAARLSSEELEGLVFLLAPEFFLEEARRRLEGRRVELAARLVYRGAMKIDTAASLAGVDKSILEERVKELRKRDELSWLEAGEGGGGS